MSKKVCMIGFAGIAPTVAMALAPTAAAQAAVTQPAKPTAKTVSLGTRAAVRPLLSCTGTYHSKSGVGDDDNTRVSGGIQWTGTQCIDAQWFHLQVRQTGLTERVRFYSAKGALEYTAWLHGTLVYSTTSFFSSPNLYAHKVCAALVANSNHNDVKYAGLCYSV